MSGKTIPCLVEGCIRPPISKGYCKPHYKKFIEIPRNKAKKAIAAEAAKPVQVSNAPVSKLASTLSKEKMEQLFLTPCRTEQDLKNFIKYFFGLHLPDEKVSRYADTTPFHAIWEAYDICVNKNNPQNVQELLYVAGRGSGKTLGMAIAELLMVFHDQRDTAHVGAILSQAKRCYEYQQKFMLNDRIRNILQPPKVLEKDRILERSNMERSVFNIGGEKVTLEVLPCTLKACLLETSKVNTPNGVIQVSELRKDDLVESPNGWAKVLDNSIEESECLEVELDDGRIIQGTLDHKIRTSIGWVCLKDLDESHEIL